jgi:hypothetical protein
MQNLLLTAERIHAARPDGVRHVSQLAVGNVVIKFLTYIDPEGIINKHLSRVAVLQSPAYRIIDDKLLEKGRFNKYMRAEKLLAHTLEEQIPSEPDLLSVGGMGIEGIDKLPPHLAIQAGLLAVREEVCSEGSEDLEVGPDLYVDGSNDFHTLFEKQFMAVALDSDPRLAGQLPRPSV